MFHLTQIDNIIEIRAVGEWSRDESLRACAEARAIGNATAVLLDLREMTNVPPPGRGPILAHEMPTLLPGRRVAFLVRENTALYGVVRQITQLTTGELQLFTEYDAAHAWLVAGPSR